MSPGSDSAFEHPDWEHFDGEDAIRAQTQARLDHEAHTRQMIADSQARMDKSKRWMIVSLCWCIGGVVFSMLGVFGHPIWTLLGFGCILVSLLMSLISMIGMTRGDRAHRAQVQARIEALRARVEAEEAGREQ